MLRAVIYARYSSTNQREQSIEGQLRVCHEYAGRNGLTVADEYVDRAISGRTDSRPAFQKLITDSKAKAFDAVIVYKTDRFSRNKYDAAVYKSLLKKKGIAIHYAAEAIPQGPEGVILESVMEGLAEYYSLELAQKIRRGMYDTAQKGKVTGGTTPLGYCISPEHYYIIEPKEAEIVKLIFQMAAAGRTDTEICIAANALGLRTKKGKAFGRSSLHAMLSNRKYTGVYKYMDTEIEGGMPRIISDDLFNEVRAVRESRPRARHSTDHVYLLSGHAFCGECGEPLYGTSGTGRNGAKYYYYYCKSLRDGNKCVLDKWPADELEDMIVEDTVRFVLRPDIIKRVAKSCVQIAKQTRDDNTALKIIQSNIAKNKNAIDTIVNLAEQGKMTDTLYARLVQLEEEKVSLAQSLAVEQRTVFVPTEKQVEYLLLQYANPCEDWDAYKKDILKSFVSKVHVYKDRVVTTFNIAKAELPDTLESSTLCYSGKER
ncbi:MAG: recombinase family protein [Eubacteriales bacterium]|nr:recombinase family protein [Eubacteriales bacterium]